MGTFTEEVRSGRRFEFGKNWARFLAVLDEERIATSVDGLRQLLQTDTLAGCSLVDVGSGSGLSSLAAMRLGAERVHSFDYDPASVACTRELKRRYFPQATSWTIEAGSALDRAYLASLGQFDFVYSWGVLHHTGAMWQAIDNVTTLVRPGGYLALALYNDQGEASRRWYRIKRAYNRHAVARLTILFTVGGYLLLREVKAGVLGHGDPTFAFKKARARRGMSLVHDLVDWIGGFPFEVASPEAIRAFCGARGFTLVQLRPDSGSGNNELLFQRETA